MEPYATRAACPKCKHDVVSTRYIVSWAMCSHTGVASPAEEEHLCRRCQRCGYSWPEACLDRVGDEVKAKAEAQVKE